MIIDNNKKEITISYDEFLSFEKCGLVSSDFLSIVNEEISKKTSISIETPIEDMYAKSIKETDSIIKGNEVYEKLYFGNNLQEGKSRWCKPELFYYLELEPERALAEIRAAAYPAVVSFFEANRGRNEVEWRTPYLSFQDRVDYRGESLPEEKNATISFYLNNNKEVKFTMGEILETYTSKDLQGKDWHPFALSRRKSLANEHKTPLLEETFVNIKTGETIYAINKQLMGESALASARNRIKNSAWFQTWEGSSCNLQCLSPKEKQSIVEKGRECIKEMHKCLLDTKNLLPTLDGKFSKVFEHEL